MKTHFRNEICAKCGKAYDPARGSCPECGTASVDFDSVKGFVHMTPMGWGKEIALFLTGWLGFQLIALAIELITLSTTKSALESAGLSQASLEAGLQAFSSSTAFYEVVDFTAYVVLFSVMLVILDKDLNRLTKKFKESRSYYGFICGVGVMFFGILYNFVISLSGLEGDNNNQRVINAMTADSPILSLVVFGLIGPFTEELAYRVGLFGVLKRINVYLAYILTALIFGFIHFDFQNAGSALEWAYLPDYVISGVLFALIYDKFGFGASYIAHAGNNFLGTLLTIIKNRLESGK